MNLTATSAAPDVSTPEPRSYRPEVRTQRQPDDHWVTNTLRFPTMEEASQNAADLCARWSVADASRAMPSPDEPTHRYFDGRLWTVKGYAAFQEQSAAIRAVNDESFRLVPRDAG